MIRRLKRFLGKDTSPPPDQKARSIEKDLTKAERDLRELQAQVILNRLRRRGHSV